MRMEVFSLVLKQDFKHCVLGNIAKKAIGPSVFVLIAAFSLASVFVRHQRRVSAVKIYTIKKLMVKTISNSGKHH